MENHRDGFWQGWCIELQLSGFIQDHALSRDTKYPGWGGSAGPGGSDTLPPCPRDGLVPCAPTPRWGLEPAGAKLPPPILLPAAPHLPAPLPAALPAPSPVLRARHCGQSQHSSCCDLSVARGERRVLREPLSHSDSPARAGAKSFQK